MTRCADATDGNNVSIATNNAATKYFCRKNSFKLSLKRWLYSLA